MRTSGRTRKPSATVLALVTALALGGQPAARAADAAPPGGPSEGIKVHGHWTIEVHNPDGTVVSRDEFENALDDGGITLAALMGRRVSGLFWHVELHGSGSDPCENGGQPVPCYVIEPNSPATPPTPWIAKNLQVLVPTGSNGLPVGTVELKGSITAGRSTSIALVRSGMTAEVANGQGGSTQISRTFTRKDLAPGTPVVAGQIVQISVVFSFS